MAGTETLAGTVTAALLLLRLTLTPPVGAALPRVTVQESVPAPVMDALEQFNVFIVGVGTVPVPVRATTAAPPSAALLVTLSCPAAAPAVAGLNLIVTPTLSPALMVRGSAVCPCSANDDPLTDAWVTTTGALP